jgi:hypothetical protein
MERNEAKEMINLALPGLSDKDKDDLADAFGDYPLVIRHVCDVFPNQAAPMANFCEQLIGDAQKLASDVETWDESILLTVLRRTVALIKQRNEDAYELLVLMTFMGYRVSRQLLATLFRHFVSDGPSINARFAYAVQTLKSFSLVRCHQEQDCPKCRLTHEFCTMHPFTQEVLRREFGPRVEEVFPVIVRVQSSLSNYAGAFPEDEKKALRNDGWLTLTPGEYVWEFLANQNAAWQSLLRQRNIDLEPMRPSERYPLILDLYASLGMLPAEYQPQSEEEQRLDDLFLKLADATWAAEQQTDHQGTSGSTDASSGSPSRLGE